MEPKRQIDGVYSSRPRPVSTGKVPQTISRSANRKHALNKRPALVLIFALVVVGLVIGVHNMLGGNASLVPKDIQKSVDFSVYYPDVKKLPAGYTLDTKSFRLADPGVVLFAVTYGDGKNITFSEQRQPSSSDIDKFVGNYIPLNTALQLTLGQAKIGAYGSAPNIRTVASLPIRSGPWLIITAPSNVNHDDLAKVLQSLTK